MVMYCMYGALQVMMREQPLKFHLKRDDSKPHTSPQSSGEGGDGIELEEMTHSHPHQD